MSPIKLLHATCMLLLCCIAFSQTSLTVKEVYDYEPGDIFYFENSSWYSFGSYSMNESWKDILILDKQYLHDSTTICYKIKNWQMSILNSPETGVYNDTSYNCWESEVSYSNLDSNVLFDQEFIWDSSYTDSALYNGRQIIEFSNCLEDPCYDPSYEATYALGLGKVYDYDNYGYRHGVERNNLLYYKKGNDTWGERDSTKMTVTLYDSITACDSYKWRDSVIYTSSNSTANIIIKGDPGFDTVRILKLTIVPTPNNSITETNNTLTASAENVNYQWLNCDQSYQAIEGATNKSYQPTKSGNYAVRLSNETCIDTSLCMPIFISSTDKKLIDKIFTVFPNPASETLSIKLHDIQEGVVRIQNATGQTVFEKTIIEGTTDYEFSTKETGVVFISIETNDACYKEKIILK